MSKCGFCHFELDESQSACRHCGQPANFPNVLAANKSDEISVIENEYDEAISKASPGVEAILKDFEKAVRLESKTVLVRPLAEILDLFDRLNNLHQTFHQRLYSGAVNFDGGRYDVNRPCVDAKLFPGYHEMITFGALNIKDTGVSGAYGKCHLVFKGSMTNHRASVFKGNSYKILESLSVRLTDLVPKGLRTTWDRRGKLAVSKFAPKFTGSTTKDDYSAILNDGADDIIEVHVFGSISHRTVEKVVVVKSSLDMDEIYTADALKRKIDVWASTVPDWDTVFMEI